MSRILLLLATIVLSTSAHAKELYVSVKLTAKDTMSSYRNDGTAYVESMAKGIGNVNISASVGFEGLSQNLPFDMATTLPDANKGEYAKITIQRTGDRLGVLHIEESVQGHHDVSDQEIQLNIGTWADFDADKSVYARLTRNGIDADRELQKRSTQALVTEMRGFFPPELSPNLAISAKTSEGDTIIVSKSSIIFSQRWLEVNFKLSTNL